MNASDHRRWLPTVLIVGVLYAVVGLLFARLAGSAASPQARVAWRLTAWAISAAAFAAHIAYEQVRLRSAPATTALHASLSVGLGAFALAVAAGLHAQAAHRHVPALALAVWPVVTALPAFLVALGAAAVLTRWRPHP